jgi:hypothetical protein
MQKPVPAIEDADLSLNTAAFTDKVVEDPEQPLKTPTTFTALTNLCQSRKRAVTTSHSLEPQTKARIRKLTKAAQGAFVDRSIMLNKNEEIFQ